MSNASRGSHRIPVIDIAPFLAGDEVESKAVIDAVLAACEGIGFFVVTGHGVPASLVDRVFDEATTFFDLTLEEKLRVKKPFGADSKGYSPQGLKTVGKDRDPTLRPSLHESYAIGPLDATDDPYYRCVEAGFSFAANHWPAKPPGMKQAMIDYYRAMERLSGAILNIFARALDVPDSYFAQRIDKHTSILRVINYPELHAEPQPGEERSAAHTDTTAITILRIDDAPGGLQVLTPSGEAIDVKRIPDSFVINIGDIMMRWTNDRFVSTMHRVVNPPLDRGRPARRMSIPFFLLPNYDAEIVCVPSCVGPGAKYAPTLVALTQGDVHLYFDGISTSVPRVRNGQLKGFAVTGVERVEAMPGIPTVGELGYPELALTVWYGLVAPARTPTEIVERLNAAVNKVMGAREITTALADEGTRSLRLSPQEFSQLIRDDTAIWRRAIDPLQLKLE